MKKITLLVFIFFCNFLSGCEDSTPNNKSNKTPKKAKAVQKQVTAKPKKRPVAADPNVDIKQTRPDNSGTSDEIEKAPEQQILDLSVPLNIKEITINDNSSNDDKQVLLPNLFPDKKQESNTVQVDGKIIRRQEEEIGKDRVVDGVGIDIKITP